MATTDIRGIVQMIGSATTAPGYSMKQQGLQVIEQVAALPYRVTSDGRVEVLLITSRSAIPRWLPPKGHLMAGLKPHEAAAQEAFEEAGISGVISDEALGNYDAVKTGADGSETPIKVTIFPMRFTRQEESWPEKGQRSARWFETESAARIVAEPGLAKIVECFRP